MVGDLACTAMLFSLVFYVRIAVSFFPAQSGGLMMQVREAAFTVTEPVMAPLRRAVPPTQGALGGLSVDVLVMFVLLIVLRSLFC